MSNIHIVAFSVVSGIETFIICVGNAFAIFVFWTQYTGSRRRSSYLLINLAVTDFFVGVSGLPSLIIDYIPSYLRNRKSEDSFAEFFSCHIICPVFSRFCCFPRCHFSGTHFRRLVSTRPSNNKQ